MSDHVVEFQGVSRRFGNTLALDNVSFQVQEGFVYGLVGANGAGKTTLIRHLLGLLRAKSGRVRVFALDPVKEPVQVLRRIGYLSEEREMPEWMRIDELLRYTRAYHPHWDELYADQLLQSFRLDPAKKVKSLSKGMRAQAGLIAAVAHRPDLLVLDEPSTGLDAIVRRDILNELVRTVADDGRTAIFSSHLLDEVEQMSDHVLMIDQGRFVLAGDLDQIKQQHQRMSIRFSKPVDSPPSVPGILSAEGAGKAWQIVCNGQSAAVREALQAIGAEILQSRNATLQEIFVARVGRDCRDEVRTDP